MYFIKYFDESEFLKEIDMITEEQLLEHYKILEKNNEYDIVEPTTKMFEDFNLPVQTEEQLNRFVSSQKDFMKALTEIKDELVNRESTTLEVMTNAAYTRSKDKTRDKYFENLDDVDEELL